MKRKITRRQWHQYDTVMSAAHILDQVAWDFQCRDYRSARIRNTILKILCVALWRLDDGIHKLEARM